MIILFTCSLSFIAASFLIWTFFCPTMLTNTGRFPTTKPNLSPLIAFFHPVFNLDSPSKHNLAEVLLSPASWGQSISGRVSVALAAVSNGTGDFETEYAPLCCIEFDSLLKTWNTLRCFGLKIQKGRKEELVSRRHSKSFQCPLHEC